MSATEGGKRVWQMLTLADEGERGGLANADSTDKNALKRANIKLADTEGAGGSRPPPLVLAEIICEQPKIWSNGLTTNMVELYGE